MWRISRSSAPRSSAEMGSPPSHTRPQYQVELEAPEVQRPRVKTRSEDMTAEHRRWTKRDKARRQGPQPADRSTSPRQRATSGGDR